MDPEITNQTILPQPALDGEAIEALRELGDGDDLFLLELLDQYLEQTDRLVLDSTEAARTGNLQAWIGTMHALAGSSRNIGALRLGAVCTAAEVDGRGSGRINTLAFQVDFEKEYDAVKRETAVLCKRG